MGWTSAFELSIHRETAAYWNGLRGTRALPRRVDVKLTDIPLLTEGLVIWDCLDNEAPRLFFSGRLVNLRMTLDGVEQPIGPPSHSELTTFLTAVRQRIFSAPLAGTLHILGRDGDTPILASSFAAALADIHDTPRYLMLQTAILPADRAEQAGLVVHMMSAPDAWWFEPVDIGYGLPDDMDWGKKPARIPH